MILIPSTAWIQKLDEGWLRMNYECSAEGFRRKGWNIERFEDTEEIDLQKGHIIHGTIESVHEFVGLDKVVEDYPEPLRTYLNRDVQKTTLGEVEGEVDIFIKPVQRKLFTGFRAEEGWHWAQTNELDNDTEVFVSDIIEIESEHRVYVGDDEIRHIGRYLGDPTLLPDIDTIQEMIQAWKDSPKAYSLDVGVTPKDETVLVEVNPMMTSGVYGVEPVELVELLELIWKEYWNNQ